MLQDPLIGPQDLIAPDTLVDEHKGDGQFLKNTLFDNVSGGLGHESPLQSLEAMGDLSNSGNTARGHVNDYLSGVDSSEFEWDRSGSQKSAKKQDKYSKRLRRKAKRNGMMAKVIPRPLLKKLAPKLKKSTNKRIDRSQALSHATVAAQREETAALDAHLFGGENEAGFGNAFQALREVNGIPAQLDNTKPLDDLKGTLRDAARAQFKSRYE